MRWPLGRASVGGGGRRRGVARRRSVTGRDDPDVPRLKVAVRQGRVVLAGRPHHLTDDDRRGPPFLQVAGEIAVTVRSSTVSGLRVPSGANVEAECTAMREELWAERCAGTARCGRPGRWS